MKCDLHVHTVHSGMCTVPVFKRICRESYNDPDEVYATLKRRGMDLVTVTDHDSIDAAESLRKYPDFFLSEEVTVRMPTGTQIHLGVYGISEKDHAEISRRDVIRPFAPSTSVSLFSVAAGSWLAAGADFDDFAEFFPPSRS
jgi:predicted metal-dependent phosphoesterase TrpH